MISTDHSGLRDLRQDPYFVGRYTELNQIITSLLQNRHTLITGDRGIGKTALIRETISILNGDTHRIGMAGKLPASGRRDCVRIDSPAPPSRLIRKLSSELLRLGMLKAVDAMKESELADAIVRAIAASPDRHIIFIDNLETITPSHRYFIERLLDVALVCGSALTVRQQPVLKKIFDSFVTVQVQPFTPGESRELVDYCLQRYGIRVLDRELFVGQLVKAGQGNPFQLKTFLHAAAARGYLSAPDIRELIRSANDRDYLNMGPLYALGLAIFSLSKILSIGASNKEFYILMSSLGFLAYLVFRIFRSFFTLKPRKTSPT